MKVSVCICSYNGEKYIAEQLNSIINQTVAVDEIILGDDNSKDRTVEIAENILKESGIDYKIFVNNPNKGVTKNFEFTCLQTTGDVVFFSDQDDIWMPNKVEKISEVFEKNESVQLVFSNATLFDENGDMEDTCWDRFGFKSNNKFYKKNQVDCILQRYFVTGATMAVRRNLIDECLPFKDILLHDMILSFVACCNNSCFAIDEKLTKYRQHSNQVLGAKVLTFGEKVAFKVDYQNEINKLQTLLSYTDNIDIRYKINKKCEFLKKREEVKKYNKFKRFFICCKLISLYKKYQKKPLYSFAKDILT